MYLKDFPDWHAVVAAHWQKTTGYLLAFREPCVTIALDELASIKGNRILVDLAAIDLAAWEPGKSWMMAVLLCPDDDVTPLITWLRETGADPRRVRFYAHPDTDVFRVLEPWAEIGFPSPAVDEDIDTWQRLHQRFGRDLAVRILQDWG